MLSCNAFAENTIGSTQNTSACKAPQVVSLGEHEILPEQFLLLVLDSLNRLYPGVLAAAQPCDMAAALRNASCAMLTNTPQFPTTPVQSQAQIAYLLNEALCA